MLGASCGHASSQPLCGASRDWRERPGCCCAGADVCNRRRPSSARGADRPARRPQLTPRAPMGKQCTVRAVSTCSADRVARSPRAPAATRWPCRHPPQPAASWVCMVAAVRPLRIWRRSLRQPGCRCQREECGARSQPTKRGAWVQPAAALPLCMWWGSSSGLRVFGSCAMLLTTLSTAWR